MSLRSFELNLWCLVKEKTGRKKLRFKDILEWSTSESAVKKRLREGEEIVEVDGVFVAIPAKQKRSDGSAEV